MEGCVRVAGAWYQLGGILAEAGDGSEVLERKEGQGKSIWTLQCNYTRGILLDSTIQSNLYVYMLYI